MHDHHNNKSEITDVAQQMFMIHVGAEFPTSCCSPVSHGLTGWWYENDLHFYI